MKSSKSLLRAVEYGSMALVCAVLVGLTGCKESSSLSSEKEITSFKATFYKAGNGADPVAVGEIDQESREIFFEVKQSDNPGNDLTWFIPKIEISADATVEPASGEEQDFSTSVVYTVTAEDGSTQKYRVTAIYEQFLTSFPISIAGIGKTITLYSTADTIKNTLNGAVVNVGDNDAKTIALSLSGMGGTKSKEAVISFTVPGEGYDSVSWVVDGRTQTNTGTNGVDYSNSANILELKAGNYTIGRHSVTFTIIIDGMPYSEQFYFTVDK